MQTALDRSETMTNHIKISPSGIVAFVQHSQAGAPSPSDDASKGFTLFSEWIDLTTKLLYTCVDPSTGAAVWVLGGGGGGGLTSPFVPLPVNSAGVNGGYQDKSVVLHTGAVANPVGAYNGGGTGNKAILGVSGFSGLPISALASIAFTWQNELGPGGTQFNPPTGANVTVPYFNLIIDFDPTVPGGNIRILSLMDSSLAPVISAAIGNYTNPGGLNTLTYSWTSAKDVIIIGSPANPTPGGVVPAVTVGPGTFDNAYSYASLIAANPNAILKDCFTRNVPVSPNGDGGLPAGAVTPGLLLVSGDSGNTTKSGKKFTSLKINGIEMFV